MEPNLSRTIPPTDSVRLGAGGAAAPRGERPAAEREESSTGSRAWRRRRGRRNPAGQSEIASRPARGRRVPLRAAAGLTALSLLPAVAAQQPTIQGGISETGLRQIPIAVPDLAATSAPTVPLARAITDIVRADLQASGYFLLVSPGHYRLVGVEAEGQIRFPEWRSIGAETLVKGEVAPDGDLYRVEARLFDTASEAMILGRRYRGGADLAAQIAHRIADDIVLHLTGQPGISLSKIAFVARTGAAKEIYLMDYDGERIRRLTQNGSLNLSPAWSPDGERIALTSFKDGQPALFILDREGRTRKMSLPGVPLNISPDWSPDGRLIAFSASRDGNADIYLLEVDSGRLRPITSGRAIDCCPSWSPNGRELAFTSDRGGTPQIYLMDAEGANVRRLTYEGSFNDSPAWSPRGDQIAFVSRLQGRFHLHVMDLGSRLATRLTFGNHNNEDPSWSPDARHLAFASDRTGTYEIYRIGAGGGEPVRLTRTEGAGSPAWSR